jgi:tetratricopeptide (TPR) repeat protein
VASTKFFSYLGNFSLARQHARVEKRAGNTAVFACILLFFAECMSASFARAEPGPEPEPQPQILMALGSEYEEARDLLKNRKWVEAAIVLRRVHKKDPRLILAAVDLARALAYLGRREEALSVLSQAAGRERGEKQRALIRKLRVISRQFLENSSFQLFQEGVSFLGARKYRVARERFEKALMAEPDNVEILIRVGQCLVMDGDFDSASERLRLAKKLNPYEPEIHLWLGRALHNKGELSDAIKELKEASAIMGASETAPVWLAEALDSSGQRSAAIQVLEQDLRTQPMHVLSLLALARLRYLAPPREHQNLWSAKKELQIALSRFEKYVDSIHVVIDGELGIERQEPAHVKAEILGLLQKVEMRLKLQTPSA